MKNDDDDGRQKEKERIKCLVVVDECLFHDGDDVVFVGGGDVSAHEPLYVSVETSDD